MTTTPITSAETGVVSPESSITLEPLSPTSVLITEQQVVSAETDIVTVDSATTLEPVSPTAVLITEQEVIFATAAAVAVPVQPVKARGWISRAIGSIVVAASATSNNEGRAEPRHYPRRYDFLESSRMAREMYRL